VPRRCLDTRAKAVLAISDYTYVLGGGQVLTADTPARALAAEGYRCLAAQFDGQVPYVVEADEHRRQAGLDLDDGQCGVELIEPDPAPRRRVQHVADEPSDDEVMGDQQLTAVIGRRDGELIKRSVQPLASEVAFVSGNAAQERPVRRGYGCGLTGGWHGSQVAQQIGAHHGDARQVTPQDLRGPLRAAKRTMPDDVKRNGGQALSQMPSLLLAEGGQPGIGIVTRT